MGTAGNIILIVYHTSLDADGNSMACFPDLLPQVPEFPAVSFGGSIPYPRSYLSNEQPDTIGDSRRLNDKEIIHRGIDYHYLIDTG